MPLLLNCPACEMGLKVPEGQRGKRVKCVCSHIFRVTGEAVAAAAQKIVVACGACQARLRVPAAALGNKVHCPSCEQIFTAVRPAPAEGATPIPGRSNKAAPSTPVPTLSEDVDYPMVGDTPPPLDFDEEEAPRRKGKGAKARPSKPVADDDWAAAEIEEEEDAPRRRKGKKHKVAEDDFEAAELDEDLEEEAPRRKGKARRAALAEADEDEERPAPAAAVPARRGLVNALTIAFSLLYFGAFFAIYFGYLDLWPRRNTAPINPAMFEGKIGAPQGLTIPKRPTMKITMPGAETKKAAPADPNLPTAPGKAEEQKQPAAKADEKKD